MSARTSGLSPRYPIYEQGNVLGPGMPGPDPFGPNDFQPAMISPSADAYLGVRGKMMAGMGNSDTPSSDGDEVKVYSNELERLAGEDDVDGNGIFDATGIQPNIHADYGVFAVRFSLPGYAARELFYRPSEVRDLTTGKPVVYVPGGAVAVDDIQVQAARQSLSWVIPPGVNPSPVEVAALEATVIPQEAAYAVHRQPDAVAMPEDAEIDSMMPSTSGLGFVEVQRNTKIVAGAVLLAAAAAIAVYAARRK